MSLSRRTFLGATAAAALTPFTFSSAADETPALKHLPIVDTHQHLWNLSKLKLPWLERAPEVYRKSYRNQEYLEATKGLDVSAVYMEVDVAADQKSTEAEHVIELCKSKEWPTRAAVIGGNPAAEGFEHYVRQFKESGSVRGVRQVLHGGSTPAGSCLKDDFVKGVRLLGTLGLSFDLCMRPAELTDGLKLTELAADTRFVIDHCGNVDPKALLPAVAGQPPSHDPDAWKRDMEKLAKRPNVICKISGVVARAPEKWSVEHLAPVVNFCLDTFGPDRVVFGGDWPVCLVRASLREWIDALTAIVSNRPVEQQRQLWSANATKFYALG